MKFKSLRLIICIHNLHVLKSQITGRNRNCFLHICIENRKKRNSLPTTTAYTFFQKLLNIFNTLLSSLYYIQWKTYPKCVWYARSHDTPWGGCQGQLRGNPEIKNKIETERIIIPYLVAPNIHKELLQTFYHFQLKGQVKIIQIQLSLKTDLRRSGELPKFTWLVNTIPKKQKKRRGN